MGGSIDEREKGRPSLVEMKEELKDAQTLKSKVQDILEQLKNQKAKSIKTTDPECTKFRGNQGSHAGYNVQTVVDEKHGLIVSGDVVNENNDYHQFADQIEQANETLEKNCRPACADSEYCDINELEKVDKQDIKVIVPSCAQAAGIGRAFFYLQI